MKKAFVDIHTVTESVGDAVVATEKLVRPVRDSLFKRFPILATLVITFGVSATLFGMERLIMEMTWFNNHPFLILMVGIMTLVVSGKLYQKLG